MIISLQCQKMKSGNTELIFLNNVKFESGSESKIKYQECNLDSISVQSVDAEVP